jgi:hypothetical protein
MSNVDGCRLCVMVVFSCDVKHVQNLRAWPGEGRSACRRSRLSRLPFSDPHNILMAADGGDRVEIRTLEIGIINHHVGSWDQKLNDGRIVHSTFNTRNVASGQIRNATRVAIPWKSRAVTTAILLRAHATGHVPSMANPRPSNIVQRASRQVLSECNLPCRSLPLLFEPPPPISLDTRTYCRTKLSYSLST